MPLMKVRIGYNRIPGYSSLFHRQSFRHLWAAVSPEFKRTNEIFPGDSQDEDEDKPTALLVRYDIVGGGRTRRAGREQGGATDKGGTRRQSRGALGG